MYFAFGLVEFIHHLLNGQEEVLAELFWGNSFHSSYLTECLGAVENISGTVHSAYSLKAKLEN